VALIILAVAGLATRYRRGDRVERLQVRWLLAAVSVVVAGVVGTTAEIAVRADHGPAFSPLVMYVGILLMPIAIGIAVLRYRLYEIDRLISRTVAYGLLSAVVGCLFVAFILVFQAVLAPLTKSNELAVAGSTLLVAALFQPLRRRLQRLVDRRFNRTRYDAERTVAVFAARLRDEVDLQQLRAEILANVAQTVEPSSVSLWLRE
jgi:hypothetical protein